MKHKPNSDILRYQARHPERAAWRDAFRNARCHCGKVALYMIRANGFCRTHKADADRAARDMNREIDTTVIADKSASFKRSAQKSTKALGRRGYYKFGTGPNA